MIYVITTTERNKRTGKLEIIVSHGVCDLTGQAVCLPCEPLEWYIRDKLVEGYAGEWVLKEKE